jgi:hypothetical protein
MHLMRSVPVSPTTTRQEYDIYRLHTPLATPEAHSRMRKFYEQVTAEDVEVCDLVQKNLERGVFVRGPLHPVHERGVKAFQNMVVERLRRHLEEESVVGEGFGRLVVGERETEGMSLESWMELMRAFWGDVGRGGGSWSGDVGWTAD